MKSPITSSYSEASGRVVGSKLAALLCAAAVLPMAAMATVTVYVGGDGASDDNTGTSSKPYATIEKTMDKVNAEGNSDDCKVYVRAGTYNVTAVKSFNKGQRMGWPLNLRPARR